MRGRGARFSRLSRITIAGAPVAPRLVAELAGILPPGGEVHTPYGATEALPVSNISGAELARGPGEQSEQGDGACIGRPVDGVEVRLIEIRDGPIPRLDPALCVEPGEPGEICVRGEVVSPAYADDAEASELAKIRDGASVWHRMGDIGCVDEDGLLWYLGRKQHRLETEHGVLHPVPFENVYDACAGVRQSALVGVGPRGAERPYLIVAPEAGVDRSALARRLLEHGRRAVLPAPLAGVLLKEHLPVDVRHNAKLHRGELKRWAERELA
jgi:acyl-CoA synthetase (AMP-forming)/AMP-acid ligase II